MKRFSITAHPHVRNSGSFFGYAYAYNEIKKYFEIYLKELDIKLEVNTPKSNIQLYFGSPHGFFYPHQYKIQMTQWESTMVPPHWEKHAKEYDEWWTANYFGEYAFLNAGVPQNKLHVFEHGVDAKTWYPKMRGQNDKTRFLHIDSGSPRKRADLVEKAFKEVFGDDPKYELTLKWSHYPVDKDANWDDIKTLETKGDWNKNVRYLKENLSLENLVKLFHFHDIFMFPSEGEGFGLIPMQAMATGMPTISTGRWCSYEEYLNGNVIDSMLGISGTKETYTRFGEMVLPDFDSTANLMYSVAQDLENQSKIFFEQVPRLTAEYDWYRLSKNMIDSLIDRVGLDMFNTSKGYLK